MLFVLSLHHNNNKQKQRAMNAIIYNKEFKAKETNGKYFYYSPKAMRWLPTSKKNIVNE